MITPSQLAAAEARRARLLRFEQAAERYQASLLPAAATPKPRPTVIEDTPEPEPEPAPPAKRDTRHYTPLWLRIVRVVARECGVTVDRMLGEGRRDDVSLARHVAVGLMREMTTLSFPQMGHKLGDRDHSTILNSRNRAQELFASEAFRNRIDQLKEEILR